MSEAVPRMAPPASEPEPEDRGLAGLRVVAWGLVCTLAWVAVTFITVWIVDAVDGGEAESEAGLLIAVVGQALAGITGWLILPRLILRRRGESGLILWRKPTGADASWSLIGLLGIFAVIYIYTAIVSAAGWDSLEPQSTIDDSRYFVHTTVMVALGILVVVLAPIYEEAFARGFVLGGLRPHWGIIPAFIVSASVFSALHADLGSMIPFALAGVILGIVYLRTGSLTAASMAHFGFNVIGYSATLVQQLG